MKQAELTAILIADPSAAINYIINNNPDAVIDRLRGYSFNIARFDDIGTALNTLLAQGENEKFIHALSVPVLTDNMDPGDVLAVKEAAIALNARAGKNVAKSLNVEALFQGLATGTLSYLNATGGKVTVKPDGGTGTPPPPPEKDNTMLYIGIGIAVTALVVVAILIFRKKT